MKRAALRPVLATLALLVGFAAPSFAAGDPPLTKLRLEGFPAWKFPTTTGALAIEEDRWVWFKDTLEEVACTGTVVGKRLRTAELRPHAGCRAHFEDHIANIIESLIVSNTPVDADVEIEKLTFKLRKLPKSVGQNPGWRITRVKAKFLATSALFGGTIPGKLKLKTLAMIAEKLPAGGNVLVVGRTGNGGVVTAGTDFDCGNDCAEPYAAPAFVVLTATPNANHSFTGWSGCDSVSGNECTVLVEGLRIVHAGFRLDLLLYPY